MSTKDGQKQNDCPSAESVVDKVESRRDTLEELAESDLPCADVAEALLGIAEEGS